MDLSLKRIAAYIIDIIIVTIVSTAIASISFLNPYKDSYNETYDKYVELSKSDGQIDQDAAMQINYDLYKYRTYSSAISVVTLLLYFGVLEYAMHGETVGKRLLKIKVVGYKDRKLNVGNHIIKVIVLNNILFTVLAFIALYLFDANVFYYVTYVISIIQSTILTIIILMIILKKDGRALHDILSSTKVVDISNMEDLKPIEIKEENKKETIKEKAEKRAKKSKNRKM